MNNRPLNFGPWTTSLDSGSRLQLSAFWKQRMRRLPELARTAGLSRRSRVATLVLAIAVGLLPLVKLVPAAPADVVAEGDFVAKFSNGVSVELIGLSENPSAEAPWWKPDGTPLKERPYHRVMANMTPSPGGIAREICSRWTGINEGADVETDWRIAPHYDGAGGGRGKNKRGEDIQGLSAWAFSLANSPDTCTVELSMSVPATPWETQIETQAGNSSSVGRRLPSGESAAVSFMRPRAEDSDTLVTMGYQVSGDVRLTALDHNGALHIGKQGGGSSVGGFAMREVRFENVIPDKLKTWQLQTRQRKTETVEFRNVSLHRGKVTDVETVMVVETKGTDEGKYAGIASPAEKNPLQERLLRIEKEREPLLAAIANNHGYGLGVEQFVRRVAPPFPPQRFLSYLAGRSEYEKTNVHPPDVMIFRWENESLRLSIMNYGGENLAGIINHVAGIKPHEVEGPEQLLKTKVIGDWIFRQGAKTNVILSGLEAILREECQIPLRLNLRDVEREVYVASGKYQFQPLPDYPAEETHFRVHRTFKTDPLEVFGKNLFFA